MLFSCLTDNINKCILTGYEGSDIERHHVFGGANKGLSEKYGFIAPLRSDLHPNGVNIDKTKRRDIDRTLKQMCQMYYEAHIGTRQEFIKEFGRNYL